jgi:3-oxoacyl-[acyl-carrier protein] reductase
MDTVVVTGASRGIGRYCAEQLHAAGYRVIGVSRTADPASPFEMRTADVSDPDSLTAALGNLKRDRSLYALVNAAGSASMNLLLTTPLATIRRIIATNLLSVIYTSQLLAPAMIRRREGRIVNFSTIAVALGLQGESVYVASKAGVEGFSYALARELAVHGITVNVVAPGPVQTNLIANVPAEKIQDIVDRQVIQQMATVEDIWRAVSMFMAPESKMMSGQIIHVGGV